MRAVLQASTPSLQHAEEIKEEEGDDGIFGVREDQFGNQNLGKFVD